MVMGKQVLRCGAGFAVITLLAAGCSGEPFGGPLWASGGAAGAPLGGQAGSGGLAGAGGSAGQPAGGQAGQDAGAPDALVEADAPEADAPSEAAADVDAALPECAQCLCAFQSGQWCGPKPPEPSSDLACSSATPHCCVCPGHCVRTGCVYSPSNPIGGHTWMCCKAGV